VVTSKRSSSRLRSNRIETTTLKEGHLDTPAIQSHLDTPAHAGYSMPLWVITPILGLPEILVTYHILVESAVNNR